MTTYQSQANAWTAFKVQSVQGTQASGAGATLLRVADGSGGIKLSKAITESPEVRRDGMRSRGRHGTQAVSGAWAHAAAIGSHEAIVEAVVRDTWDATALTITEATGGLTSITTTTSTIVNGGGSWITAGLRVGDVIILTNHTTAANNSKNLRITGLTASTITVAETLVLNATPDTAFTITRPKKLIQFSAGALVPRWFTTEDYEIDIDGSEVATDFVWSSIKYSMQTNGILMADPGGVGTGQFQTLTGASSPLLTSPTEGSAVPLSVVDATIRLGGSDVADLTSFDLTLDVGANAPATFGVAAQKYSPTVLTGAMGINLSITALRKDLAYVANYVSEDVLSLHVLAVENESEPKDFLSIYIPNFTLGNVDKSALNRAAGPRTQTLQVPVGLVGKDTTGGAFAATMIAFQSTGA